MCIRDRGLIVEHGTRGEQALAQAGPDAADVIYDDFADAMLRKQAVEALAVHGTMALAMLDKYATDADFRDILRTYPEYPGRERWTDRVFYRGGDGIVRSVAQVWEGREPLLVAGAAAAVQFFGESRFRPAMRLFLSERGELHS